MDDALAVSPRASSVRWSMIGMDWRVEDLVVIFDLIQRLQYMNLAVVVFTFAIFIAVIEWHSASGVTVMVMVVKMLIFFEVDLSDVKVALISQVSLSDSCVVCDISLPAEIGNLVNVEGAWLRRVVDSIARAACASRRTDHRSIRNHSQFLPARLMTLRKRHRMFPMDRAVVVTRVDVALAVRGRTHHSMVEDSRCLVVNVRLFVLVVGFVDDIRLNHLLEDVFERHDSHQFRGSLTALFTADSSER